MPVQITHRRTLILQKVIMLLTRSLGRDGRLCDIVQTFGSKTFIHLFAKKIVDCRKQRTHVHFFYHGTLYLATLT